jgi:hypothetical protein
MALAAALKEGNATPGSIGHLLTAAWLTEKGISDTLALDSPCVTMLMLEHLATTDLGLLPVLLQLPGTLGYFPSLLGPCVDDTRELPHVIHAAMDEFSKEMWRTIVEREETRHAVLDKLVAEVTARSMAPVSSQALAWCWPVLDAMAPEHMWLVFTRLVLTFHVTDAIEDLLRFTARCLHHNTHSRLDERSFRCSVVLALLYCITDDDEVCELLTVYLPDIISTAADFCCFHYLHYGYEAAGVHALAAPFPIRIWKESLPVMVVVPFSVALFLCHARMKPARAVDATVNLWHCMVKELDSLDFTSQTLDCLGLGQGQGLGHGCDAHKDDHRVLLHALTLTPS